MTSKSWKTDLSFADKTFFFSKIDEYISLKNNCFSLTIFGTRWILTTKRWLILSSSRNSLNYQVKFLHAKIFFFFFFWMLPVGKGFVIAFPYWLFSSIFNIFVIIRLCSFSILYIIFKFSFGLPSEFFGSKSFESNSNLVLRQLNLLISVCSNKSTISARVGSAIIAFSKNLWMHPLSELAEVHSRGLLGNF